MHLDPPVVQSGKLLSTHSVQFVFIRDENGGISLDFGDERRVRHVLEKTFHIRFRFVRFPFFRLDLSKHKKNYFPRKAVCTREIIQFTCPCYAPTNKKQFLLNSIKLPPDHAWTIINTISSLEACQWPSKENFF